MYNVLKTEVCEAMRSMLAKRPASTVLLLICLQNVWRSYGLDA